MNNFSLVLRVANLLSNEADVKPGDRVMVILPAIPEYWLIQAACLRTGTEYSFFFKDRHLHRSGPVTINGLRGTDKYIEVDPLLLMV